MGKFLAVRTKSTLGSGVFFNSGLAIHWVSAIFDIRNFGFEFKSEKTKIKILNRSSISVTRMKLKLLIDEINEIEQN
jgi:hypothetical protein